MENKRSIFFLGAIALFVNVGIFSVSIYFGSRYGISLSDAIVSLRKTVDLDFSFLNSLSILVCCITVNSEKSAQRWLLPILFFSFLMIALNLFYISKNIFFAFNLIFWGSTAYYLLKHKGKEKLI
jgi:hypothetical protein